MILKKLDCCCIKDHHCFVTLEKYWMEGIVFQCHEVKNAIIIL